VLAIHGFGSGGMPFTRTLQRLRSVSRHVGVLESPGHGFSDLPADALTPETWLAAVHGALDAALEGPLRCPVLLGNSLGGALTVRYALARPERLSGVVLCSPAGAPLSATELADLRRGFTLDSPAAAKAFVERLFARAPWYAPLAAPEVRRRMNRPHLRQFLETVGPESFLTAEDLAGLDVPTLVLWGEGDRILPSSGRDFFERSGPACLTVETAPDIGHCPQIERPDWLADRVARFLATRAR
jgi:pimeloyl-ACP methyl ester carboxylesterase